MKTSQLILVDQFCAAHEIKSEFISELHQYGLIEITSIDENNFLAPEYLKTTEQMVRLHYELGINLEGIDAIANLLKRIEDLQQELLAVRNRLKRFE